MTLLMLDAGLRVGELVQLHRSDLVSNSEPVQTLTMRAEITKGRHERLIPISFRIRVAIEAFRIKHWHPEEPVPHFYAFCRWRTYSKLTARQVEYVIAHASKMALGERIHPHVLRHTFASRLMRTTNIRIVQELLGHKNLSSTQIYTHPNSNDLRKAIDSITE